MARYEIEQSRVSGGVMKKCYVELLFHLDGQIK